ncbi:hypothetical protein EDB83DRAFT_2322096 [Lactarius deliciosus]|nr:hypothetical protein EDB83DRAFT_2322096 [Lactarius deliciosus]
MAYWSPLYTNEPRLVGILALPDELLGKIIDDTELSAHDVLNLRCVNSTFRDLATQRAFWEVVVHTTDESTLGFLEFLVTPDIAKYVRDIKIVEDRGQGEPPGKRGARVPFRVPPCPSFMPPYGNGRGGAPPSRVEPLDLVGTKGCAPPFHSTPPSVRASLLRTGVGGAPVPPLRENGGKRREGGSRAVPPFAQTGAGGLTCTGEKGWAYLSRAPFARKRARGVSPFRAYREAAKGDRRAACPRAPLPRERGRKGPRADGAAVEEGEGPGAKGGGMPSCTPLPREWGRERLRVAFRILPFRAYRAPRPKEEGGGPGIACPLSARTGRAAEGGGAGATCPRALPFCVRVRGYGKGGPQTTGHALVCPPSARTWWRGRKREGPGGGGHRAPERKRGGQGVPLPMRLPICAQTEAGAQRGGLVPRGPRPVCTAARKREGRGARGKWGPAVPAPVPPLRENRDEGSKDLFPFPRKRRRGRKGRPSPRSCILFGRNRGGQGGKRGRPREEAEGGQRGAVRCAATRRGAPPTWPIGHAERGDIKEGGRTDRKGRARERVERGARIAQGGVEVGQLFTTISKQREMKTRVGNRLRTACFMLHLIPDLQSIIFTFLPDKDSLTNSFVYGVNLSRYQLLQLNVLEGLAYNPNPLPTLQSLHIHSWFAFRQELYATAPFQAIVASLQDLCFLVQDTEFKGEAEHGPAVDFLKDIIELCVLRPAVNLTSLAVKSSAEFGWLFRLDLNSITFPSLTELSLTNFVWDDGTVDPERAIPGVEYFILCHGKTLKILQLHGCTICIPHDRSAPVRSWAAVWNRFAEELADFVILEVVSLQYIKDGRGRES